MLNQGRPLLRVERSGARKGKGDGREWGAPGPGFGIPGSGFRVGEVVYTFLLMVEMPAPGGASLSGWRVSGANTADFWVGGEPVRWVGIRIMSGANTALFWSVKSLWSGMEQQRNGG